MSAPLKPHLAHLVSFAATDLGVSDAELGRRLMAYWVLAAAEDTGTVFKIGAPSLAKYVLSRLPEAASAKYASLEKAYRNAAQGDLEAAGRLFREHVNAEVDNRANALLVERYLAERTRSHVARKTGGKRRGEKLAEKLAKRDAAIRTEFVEMGRTRETRGKLAKKYELSKSRIRTITRGC